MTTVRDAAFPGPQDRACVDAIRVLAMDAVQKANSGHPGTPMALAPLAYVLWTRHLRHDPRAPEWPDRDRFVLSCGHASMLLYASLHLAGYDLSLDDLRAFRQWGSRTPGHPEHGHTPGVETTTGPLGQGVGNAVGMALAAAHVRAELETTGASPPPLAHRTWFICSDGDLMEGLAQEAISLAGHLRIPHLIGFYDDNRITIEGSTDLAFSDDVATRFEGCGWQVLHVADGNDLAALDAAMVQAQEHAADRPVLVIVRTQIAWGSPNKQGSHEAHGAPLGADEIAATRRNLGWPESEAFVIPAAVRDHWGRCVERGAALRDEWNSRWKAWSAAAPDAARDLERRWRRELPRDWAQGLDDLPSDAVATRVASGKALNAIAPRLPELLGGSADLAPSNNSLIQGSADVAPGRFAGRNLHFGVREHAMGAILNGMALHGGVLPYGATFLIFSDYMRGAIRLASLMHLHVLYVFTHDSIGLGEDGPTHQPIETLAALRAIPGLLVVRPADAIETRAAWRLAITHRDGPCALVLTRQKTPALDRSRAVAGSAFDDGAYILSEARGDTPQVILIASGSEVGVAVEAQALLEKDGLATRVVSAPCLESFATRPQEHRDRVLPPSVRARVAVEAAHPQSWYRWVGDGGDIVGLDHFGASAPAERLFAEFGITALHVAARARAAVARAQSGGAA